MRARGQSVVEYGLVIVGLVIIIGAGIDLGLMVTTRQNVSVATGEAARQAAYGANPIDIIGAAKQAATGSLASPSGLAVAVTYVDGPNTYTYCSGFQSATDPVKPPGCLSGDVSVSISPGATVTVTLWEETYEIVTPMMRQWAHLSGDDLCQQADKPCYMRLTASETVRYPGPAPTQ